jgi:hypothetical protein
MEFAWSREERKRHVRNRTLIFAGRSARAQTECIVVVHELFRLLSWRRKFQ